MRRMIRARKPSNSLLTVGFMAAPSLHVGLMVRSSIIRTSGARVVRATMVVAVHIVRPIIAVTVRVERHIRVAVGQEGYIIVSTDAEFQVGNSRSGERPHAGHERHLGPLHPLVPRLFLLLFQRPMLLLLGHGYRRRPAASCVRGRPLFQIWFGLVVLLPGRRRLGFRLVCGGLFRLAGPCFGFRRSRRVGSGRRGGGCGLARGLELGVSKLLPRSNDISDSVHNFNEFVPGWHLGLARPFGGGLLLRLLWGADGCCSTVLGERRWLRCRDIAARILHDARIYGSRGGCHYEEGRPYCLVVPGPRILR